MLDCDNLFLIVLTAISFLILAIDLKVLEKMFEEYFRVRYYLPEDTYEHCYKPQAEMRMAFECYAIYSAVICSTLTTFLALGFDDEKLEWLAKKIINVSFMIYGPVMTTICVYGFCDIKALSRVCTLHGISEKHTNFVTLFVLFACFGFSIGVSFAMAMERTLDIAQSIFSQEDSILFRITQIYFRYQTRLRNASQRERGTIRRERRAERQADRAAAQEFLKIQKEIEEKKQRSKLNYQALKQKQQENNMTLSDNEDLQPLLSSNDGHQITTEAKFKSHVTTLSSQGQQLTTAAGEPEETDYETDQRSTIQNPRVTDLINLERTFTRERETVDIENHLQRSLATEHYDNDTAYETEYCSDFVAQDFRGPRSFVKGKN